MMVGVVEGVDCVGVGVILFDLFEQDSNEIVVVLGVVIGCEVGWVVGVMLDEIVDLLEVVVGFNRDFFVFCLWWFLLQVKFLVEESMVLLI